jgi:hypothetical protein
MKKYLSLILCILVLDASSQVPNMVKDCNPGLPDGLLPGTKLYPLNNGVVFPAKTSPLMPITSTTAMEARSIPILL